GLRCVVNDLMSSRSYVESMYGSSFSTDDSTFHFITGKINHRHRRFHDMLTGAPLNAAGNDALGLFMGSSPSLLFDFLDQANSLASGIDFHLFQQLPFR